MGKERRDYRREVLTFLESYVAKHGYPPTCEEIRQAIGLSSKSHVLYYLDLLAEEGKIERKPHTPRGLRLVGLRPKTFEVEVEGYIAAGQPLGLADGLGIELELTPDIADPRRDLFALEVQGDSMVDDLVGDGDILIVERRQEAHRGQMAVVHLLDRNEATLKRFYPEGRRVRLQPAHPTLEPIYVDARDVQVQGRVVAVIRRI
jgi:repressor LexA